MSEWRAASEASHSTAQHSTTLTRLNSCVSHGLSSFSSSSVQHENEFATYDDVRQIYIEEGLGARKKTRNENSNTKLDKFFGEENVGEMVGVEQQQQQQQQQVSERRREYETRI